MAGHLRRRDGIYWFREVRGSTTETPHVRWRLAEASDAQQVPLVGYPLVSRGSVIGTSLLRENEATASDTAKEQRAELQAAGSTCR